MIRVLIPLGFLVSFSALAQELPRGRDPANPVTDVTAEEFPASGYALGQIMQYRGSVSLKRRDMMVEQTLMEDLAYRINPGDSLATGADGRVEISMTNGMQLIIEPDSVVTFSYDQDFRSLGVEVFEGTMHVNGENQVGMSCVVRAGSGAVSFSQASFSISRQPDESVMVNMVTGEGQVEMDQLGGVIPLASGQTAVLENGDAEGRLTVSAPPDNTGNLVMRLAGQVTVSLPPGTRTQFENLVQPGEGGAYTIWNLEQKGEPVMVRAATDVTETLFSGEKAVLEFVSDEELVTMGTDVVAEDLDGLAREQLPGEEVPSPQIEIPERHLIDKPSEVRYILIYPPYMATFFRPRDLRGGNYDDHLFGGLTP